MINLMSIVLTVLLCNCPLLEAQEENITDPFADDIEIETGDPWETPFQELFRISPKCKERIPDFDKISWTAEVEWQRCMDSINPHIPVLESNSSSNTEKVNASVYLEIENKVHMAICRNTTAFKSCWVGILATLDKCQKGAGYVSGELYFALYEDICREGGRFTVENRKKSQAQGSLCGRDYKTRDCRKSKRLQEHADFYQLCTRFRANVACDLSSIDLNCSNVVDKMSHAEIFQRVGTSLKCIDSRERVDNFSKGSLSGIRICTFDNMFLFVACFLFGILKNKSLCQ